MTLYTAIGKYEFRKDKKGNRFPVVIVADKEYILNVWEMLLWSSLIWNIYTYDEITKIFYKKEREIHVLGELTCESYIDRLEKSGLVVSGHGITAADALYGLLSKLYVIPVKANFLKKSAAFLHMTYIRKVPFNITKHIFDKLKFTASETKIMKLVAQNRLSVGELIKCVECGIVDVSTNDKLIDSLYDDDITSYKNIGVLFRTCGSCNLVLEMVASLYLNKHILFEK